MTRKLKKGAMRFLRIAITIALMLTIVPQVAFADETDQVIPQEPQADIQAKEDMILQEETEEPELSATEPIVKTDLVPEPLAQEEVSCPRMTSVMITVVLNEADTTKVTVVLRKENAVGEIAKQQEVTVNAPTKIEGIEEGIYHVSIEGANIDPGFNKTENGITTSDIPKDTSVEIKEGSALELEFEIVSAAEDPLEVIKENNQDVSTTQDQEATGEGDQDILATQDYVEYTDNGEISWSKRFSDETAAAILAEIWSTNSNGVSVLSDIMPFADDIYIGQILRGTCYIGSHVTSGNYSSFQVSFGDASFTGTMTFWCLDPGAAEPYPQNAPYRATVTAIDYTTGIVTYSFYVTPAGAWNGVSYANGLPAGYQHVGGLVGVARDFDPGVLYLQKVDADTGLREPQGNAKFTGAQFLLTNVREGTTWVLTLPESGYLRQDRLPLGDYTLIETMAPEGYELDPTLHEFTIGMPETGQNQITITARDKVKTENLEINKVDMDIGIGVPNTEFELFLYKGAGAPEEYSTTFASSSHAALSANPFAGVDTNRWELKDVQVTDANGTHIFEDLPYGYYLVHESAPNPEYSEWWETAGTSLPWYCIFIDGTEKQVQLFENEKINIECNVYKNTIERTSAAFSGDHANNVGTERYLYDINFDNGATNVRADQYTVIDNCEFTQLGLRLDQLWTPVVINDTDGTYNIKYRTNFSNGSSAMSATSSNPANKLADGSNRIDAASYHDWATGISSVRRIRLDVVSLGLAPGEYITELLLEYGSVEVEFKTTIPLEYSVYATEALAYNNDTTVIPNSVSSHITRNWNRTRSAGAGLYDDAQDAVETRVVDTFSFAGGTTPTSGEYRGSGGYLPKTGDNDTLLASFGLLMLLSLALVSVAVRKHKKNESFANTWNFSGGLAKANTSIKEVYMGESC